MVSFASKVLAWYDQSGRHDLPWQREPTPYRVWVSEIMLQQTQVATVIPYFERFMARFPKAEDLAAADIDQVLHLWSGLGYYARARNLYHAAQEVMSRYKGEFPQDVTRLAALPGIGRSTAGAIAALSMGLQAPVLDGNVKRVLCRTFAIGGYPEQSKVRAALWEKAESLLPETRIADYTQAIMDLGSLVCTRSQPHCDDCPLRQDCMALAADAVAEYPERKPSRDLPTKAVTMLVVQNEHSEVLLERRPPTGVWASLYSFPEHTGSTGLPVPATALKENPHPLLPPIHHTFSHYHLHIHLTRLRVIGNSTNSIADSNCYLWYPLDHSVEVGLPAPIKSLLDKLATELAVEQSSSV